jgi:hypothetical protein
MGPYLLIEVAGTGQISHGRANTLSEICENHGVQRDSVSLSYSYRFSGREFHGMMEVAGCSSRSALRKRQI